MTPKKKQRIARALSGITYAEWREVSHIVENSYHTTKKELTSEEINSKLNAFPLMGD
ncbi:hypothetical protein [Eupransor demetentiae]|uniref:hypothetical protein n=1 Tax=Eupransor demetentiae TaxID=3109584 RepID=UPI0032E364E7